jgi:hypothetical protein
MSFLKQILSPFVEFTDDKKPVEPVKENKNQKVETTTATPDENAPIPFTTNADINLPLPSYTITPDKGNVALLPEHQKHFENLIEEANAKNPLFVGTDYKEFADAKIDIDAITDEEKKYQTAFNVLKRTGLTKEKLISTGQEYINIIGRDLNGFQGAHAQQYKKEVTQNELLIQKKAEEMQALREKINALQTEVKQISEGLIKTKERLTVTRNSFLLAGENKQQEIYNELQKIAKYFK